METKKQQVVTYAGAILIAALLIGFVFSQVSVSKNKKNLYAEKQTSEKLLSEKLSAEKELLKMKTDFSSLKQRSDENQRLLDETNARISENERKLNALTSENRSLRSTRKELEELKKSKANLEQESALLKSEYDQLMSQNRDLQNALYESERKYLALQQENSHRINPDNFLVTATRGKKAERVVIRAARAKKLNMAFEVPQTLTESISFKLTTPAGTTINPDDKSLSWVFPLEPRSFTASLSSETGEFEPSRQVVLNYMPDKKLTKGEYKVQIYSGNKNIGNCRIYLR